MKEKISELLKSATESLKVVSDRKSLDEIRVKYLGKSGSVTELLKGMRDVAPEERPKVGQLVNDLRQKIEALIAEKEAERKKAELEKALKAEAVDVTLPGKKQQIGSLHPINLVRNELIEAFTGMGFEIYEGPEIELDEYNFRLLNIPEDHPSRDMQDSGNKKRPDLNRAKLLAVPPIFRFFKASFNALTRHHGAVYWYFFARFGSEKRKT